MEFAWDCGRAHSQADKHIKVRVLLFAINQ
jgi:hypothetical protein